MFLEVSDSQMKTRDTVLEAAKTIVAQWAKKLAQLACGMIVVNGQHKWLACADINRHLGVATNGARAFLSSEQSLPVLQTNPVKTKKVSCSLACFTLIAVAIAFVCFLATRLANAVAIPAIFACFVLVPVKFTGWKRCLATAAHLVSAGWFAMSSWIATLQLRLLVWSDGVGVVAEKMLLDMIAVHWNSKGSGARALPLQG